MRNFTLTALLAILLLAVSCNGSGNGSPAEPKDIPDLILTVPSDALAVVCSGKASNALSYLDSTDVLRSLSLGKLDKAHAVLSFCYNGSLVPVFAVEAAMPQEGDTLSDISRLQRQASELRLYSAVKQDGRRGVLIVTPSEAEIQAVRRHLEEGTSILAASGFADALNARDSQWDFAIIRNSGANRLIPRNTLSGMFAHREITSFVRTVCDWTVVSRQSKDESSIRLVRGGGGEYFANMVENLEDTGTNLAPAIPACTEFAVSMAVSNPGFREAFRRYKDASVKLQDYEKKIAALKKSTGKDPLKWEQEVGVKEVALVCIPEGKIFMARPSKPVADKPVEENPYRGFAEALYGSAFSAGDDSCVASYGGWNIYGSAETLEAFIAHERNIEGIRWPKGCRLVLYRPGETVAWGKKGITLWNTNH